MSERKSRWSWSVDSATTRADSAILEAIENDLGKWEGEPLSVSRSRIQKLIESGAVLCDGVLIQPRSKLSPGAQVLIDFPVPKPLNLVPEERAIEILFQDEHLLVINKPPGLTVHPSETQPENTLVHALLHQVAIGKIQGLSGIGGVLRPGIVHRIDKDTSGAIVVSKTDTAHQGLTLIFSKHEIERKYEALCFGTPSLASGTISSTLGRSPKDRKKMAMNVKHGRNAITHYRRLEDFAVTGKKPFASHLELTLETGRTHQIRVHLTGLGYSILGDPSYGTPTETQPKWTALPTPVRKAIADLPGQALHARWLGFIHPITGEKMLFEAEPPQGFRDLLKILSEYR